MAKRSSIPQKVKLQVWSEAAGRCQFRGCNTPLWYNELTLNSKNFAELAHIIGANTKGPRGNKLSEMLSKEPDNIMLLCKRCHSEIDDPELHKNYPEELLRTMKKEHAHRVRMLLDRPGKKTWPLVFTSKIGNQNSAFGVRGILTALLPDYPEKSSEDWFRIEIGSFDRAMKSAWEVAMVKIEETIESIDRACKNKSLSHLSVFGIAAQPLLMYLGRLLGDKISMQIFEPRRTDDLDKKWLWEEDNDQGVTFTTELIQAGTGNNAILLIELSDYLSFDKYKGMIPGNPFIYQLTIEEPVQGFLTKKSDKAKFILSCRSLLNKMQKDTGRDCIVHVLPAMPASLAIEFGRLLQPTKDPQVWIYENVDGTKPIKVLELL